MIYNVELNEMEKMNKPLIINNNKNKNFKYIVFVTISSILILGICFFYLSLIYLYNNTNNNNNIFTSELIEKLFNDTTSKAVSCNNISFALCDISTCDTYDNIIAICGCLTMNSSVKSTLALGWQSPTLAASEKYLEWLYTYNMTTSIYLLKNLEKNLCDMLPTLWSDVGIKDSKLISIYGSDSYENNLNDKNCENVYGANCQGAPCFSNIYENMWNVTCLCQLMPKKNYMVKVYGDNSCEEIEDKCAVSTSDYNRNWNKISEIINMMVTKSKNIVEDISSKKCPIIAF
tara:strand:- start:5798 stop:6664 length:867 start_codon:yes stop_codon:yes gene_type:complete